MYQQHTTKLIHVGALMMAASLMLPLAGCSSTNSGGKSGSGFQIPDINIGGVPIGGIGNAAVDIKSSMDSASEVMTPDFEYSVGQGAAAQIINTYGVYNDAKANEYINLVGHSLVQFSTRPEIYNGYHFQILDSAEINAFAAPNGAILITRGMLRLCESEDEVAAVLAHEIAHIQDKHALQMIEASRQSNVWKSFGSAAINLGTDGAAKQLFRLVGPMIESTYDTLTKSGYSKPLETEADTKGVEILRRTGYDPNAMVSLLTKMDAKLESGKGFGSTHPHTEDRIATAKKAVGNVDPRPANAITTQRFNAALKAARAN